MKDTMEIVTYDVEKYNFPKIIFDFLDMGNLDALSPEFDRQPSGSNDSLYKNMERTKAYSQLYEALSSEGGKRFYDAYQAFIEDVIKPRYGDTLYYQEKPTHRILYADAPGVSRFHRDRDYGHDPREINFFVPQTATFDTNTLWIESEEGKEDFRPIVLNPGQFLRFDGANLMHGAKENRTGKTRVSFDFRILPVDSDGTSRVSENEQDDNNFQNTLKANAHGFVLSQ
jgi:hypothetical protein